MRTLYPLLVLAIVACGPKGAAPVAPAASQETVRTSVMGQAFGGAVLVEIRCPSAALQGDCMNAAVAARDEISRLEALTTDWSAAGEIGRLNASAGSGAVAISADVERLLKAGQVVATATDGAFDVTIGGLWGLWGVDEAELPSAAEMAARLDRVDYRKLTVNDGEAALADEGMAVNLGGVVQGDAAARGLATIPEDWEAKVDVSGDIAVRGTWQVGIQHPQKPRGTLVGTVSIRDSAIVTSGDYIKTVEAGTERFRHNIDPRTGAPANGALLATVAHVHGGIADGLATALLVTGADTDAIAQLGAWALVFTEEGAEEIGDRGERVLDWTPDR